MHIMPVARMHTAATMMPIVVDSRLLSVEGIVMPETSTFTHHRSPVCKFPLPESLQVDRVDQVGSIRCIVLARG